MYSCLSLQGKTFLPIRVRGGATVHRLNQQMGCFHLQVLIGVSSAFADCLSLLGLLRFFVGFFLVSFMLSAYVYTIELLAPKRRAMGGQINHVFWSPGYCSTALVAYFLRDWRYLVVVMTVSPVLFLLAYK